MSEVKVKLKSIYASPEKGTASPGAVITVDAEEAKALVEGNYAEYVDKPETETGYEVSETSDAETEDDGAEVNPEPTYQELKARAKELGVDGYARMNAETLKAAIADKEKEAEGED